MSASCRLSSRTDYYYEDIIIVYNFGQWFWLTWWRLLDLDGRQLWRRRLRQALRQQHAALLARLQQVAHLQQRSGDTRRRR